MTLDAPSPGRGWLRVLRGNRALWIATAVALASLVGGLLIGRFLVSPADADASAPAPGLVTVPVEFGELRNDVTTRGDVGFADPIEVAPDVSGLTGKAVVTGQVPAVDSMLGPRSIALEVVGRPVIVLPGELPAYRTLRLGVSGPDVVQLKRALVSLGINPGNADSALFDASTARAVGQLYASVGYPAPAPPEGAEKALDAARQGLSSADQAVQSASSELRRATSGPAAVEVKEADNMVGEAQRALNSAQNEVPVDANRVADLKGALELAQLRRSQLDAAQDASAQRTALDGARQMRADAAKALEQAQADLLPSLPAGEVLYLTDLPRRVDDVAVKVGQVLDGTAMTVSGAELQVAASVADADATLLDVGMKAEFELPDGTPHSATIAQLEQTKDSSRWSVTLVPDPLTAEQSAAVQGQNIRLRIPVGATEGKVLQVPVAALTAGPGGETRVEVAVDDPRKGEKARTRLVDVTTGLAAAGVVEVVPVADGDLGEGDLVVVGR